MRLNASKFQQRISHNNQQQCKPLKRLVTQFDSTLKTWAFSLQTIPKKEPEAHCVVEWWNLKFDSMRSSFQCLILDFDSTLIFKVPAKRTWRENQILSQVECKCNLVEFFSCRPINWFSLRFFVDFERVSFYSLRASVSEASNDFSPSDPSEYLRIICLFVTETPLNNSWRISFVFTKSSFNIQWNERKKNQ